MGVLLWCVSWSCYGQPTHLSEIEPMLSSRVGVVTLLVTVLIVVPWRTHLFSCHLQWLILLWHLSQRTFLCVGAQSFALLWQLNILTRRGRNLGTLSGNFLRRRYSRAYARVGGGAFVLRSSCRKHTCGWPLVNFWLSDVFCFRVDLGNPSGNLALSLVAVSAWCPKSYRRRF